MASTGNRIAQSRIPLFAAVLGAALAFSLSVVAAPGYHVLQTITLGGDGGWDYLNLDPASGNLFITRGSHVMVVNPDSGKLVADIAGLQGIYGTAFVNGRAYVTEGGSNMLAVIDTQSFARLSEIPVGTRPDGILYDPVSGRVFTFNATSGDATAVDPATGKAVGTVPLGGKPEAAASDGAGTIYVNIEDKSELVAFDAATLAVKRRMSLAPCESPSGIAGDFVHGQVFSGCDNKMIAVTDIKSGKVVAQIPIGDGVDSNRFDPATGLVFSSNGESGTLTVAHEDSPDKYTVIQQLVTAEGARTMELDPRSHKVFLVTADRRPGTPTADRPKPRPVPVPGTFRLLILGR